MKQGTRMNFKTILDGLGIHNTAERPLLVAFVSEHDHRPLPIKLQATPDRSPEHLSSSLSLCAIFWFLYHALAIPPFQTGALVSMASTCRQSVADSKRTLEEMEAS
jgi:hypothetical protein